MTTLSAANPTRFSYPGRMGQMILMAYQEVLGSEALRGLLQDAHCETAADPFPTDTLVRSLSFSTLGALEGALDQLYGEQAGRGMSLRAGRVLLQRGLRDLGAALDSANQCRRLRMLPLRTRILRGADLLSAFLNRNSDQQIDLRTEAKDLLWTNRHCPCCWGRQTHSPCCHLAVGSFLEGLAWLSGGKHFAVEEIACAARGDPACTFRIALTPIE